VAGENNDNCDADDEASDSESEDVDTEGEVEDGNLQNDRNGYESAVTLHRFPRIAHTLQVVLKDVDRHPSYVRVLSQVKVVVKKTKVSSVAGCR